MFKMSTGDIFTTSLKIPKDMHIPENLPSKVKELFSIMKSLNPGEFQASGVVEKLNTLIRDPSNMFKTGTPALPSDIKKGDLVFYENRGYLVIDRIIRVDAPDEIVISIEVSWNPARATWYYARKGVNYFKGAKTKWENVHIKVTEVVLREGKYYIASIPFDGWNVAGWLASTAAVLCVMSVVAGGAASLEALRRGAFSFPQIARKVYNKSWVPYLSTLSPYFNRVDSQAN